MRVPGADQATGWAVRVFRLTPHDIAGVRRGWGVTKAYLGGALSDLLVTGGQLWDAMFTHPRIAITTYVIPTFTAALGKTRRAYRTADPQDSYGQEGEQ
jgi:hypothetical protein